MNIFQTARSGGLGMTGDDLCEGTRQGGKNDGNIPCLKLAASCDFKIFLTLEYVSLRSMT